MKSPQKRSDFVNSEEGIAIKKELQRMTADEAYNTPASYTAKILLYPNNEIPFTDKHMNYISSHPQLDPKAYLANLQLMTKVKKHAA